MSAMTNFNIITKTKQLCYRNRRQLCTTWSCKYSNPPQAAAGKYNCLGCTSGTYIVRPENVSGESSYPLIPPPSRQDQRKALERIQAERREEATRALRAKPLPETPGLAQRAGAVTPEHRTRLAEKYTPPRDDGYRPPLRAKHSSASRNLRKRQLIYPVDGYDSDAVSNMSCAGSMPGTGSVAGCSSTGSKFSTRSGRGNGPRPPLPPLYYPTAPHNVSAGSKHPMMQYEVSIDGRIYF